ncbi:putative reverse transcriptase domain-containing protein [Tanacetum coccineum]
MASQDIRSCQKEYHELRTLYNALKVKFDSLNQKRRETNVSKSSKPRESVSAKVHTGESSKPFSRRVSQFTTYSLQKDRKFSKNSQSFETLTPQKGFKKRASNAKHQSFETTYSCFTPKLQKTYQDGFTVKNDDMKRSQRQSQQGKWKDQVEKRGNVGEPSKDKNGKDDNKRTRTGNAFATTANFIGRENTSAWPKRTNYNSYHVLGGLCRTCFNCNCPGHFAKDCRVVPRNVNPVNVKNPAPARRACYEYGSTDHLKPACPSLRNHDGGRALIHKNREDSKHKGQRIRPTIGDFGGNCASNQSLFNYGRIEEWEEKKKED